eukprot:gene4000-7256_t
MDVTLDPWAIFLIVMGVTLMIVFIIGVVAILIISWVATHLINKIEEQNEKEEFEDEIQLKVDPSKYSNLKDEETNTENLQFDIEDFESYKNLQITCKCTKTKVSQKISLKKSAADLLNEIVFLKVSDINDTIIIEIGMKTLLSIQLLSSVEVSLNNIFVGIKREYKLNLKPFGKIKFSFESFNFGNESKSATERELDNDIIENDDNENENQTKSLMDAKQTKQEKYLIVKLLGKGGMGEVFEAIENSTRKRVALKKVYCRTIEEMNHALNESLLTKNLTHENLVQYYDMYFDQKSKKKRILCLVMEFLENGDLQQLLQKKIIQGSFLTEKELLDYFKQILKGLVYFHSKNLIHRDLKPENFFLTNDYKTLKIGDFGLIKPETDESKSTAGTNRYMSPEVMAGRETYNKKADIWSLGCSFYEMMILSLDYTLYIDLFLNEDFYKNIEQKITKNYSKKYSKLIIELLQKNPEKRPSSEELLKKIENFDDHYNDDEEIEKLKNEDCFDMELLEKVSFLKNASKELIQSLVSALKPKLFKKGENIIKFGDEGNCMYFINKGICTVTSGDGKQVFNVLSEGSFFGEYAILYPLKRTANVMASCSCDLFELSKNDFHIILKEFPEFELGIRRFGLGLILKRIMFFQSFSEEDLDEFATYFTPRSFLTTDIVIEKEQKGDLIYFVYNGNAAIMNEEGMIQKIYHNGDEFGSEILTESRYNESVISLTCLDVIEISTDDYKKITAKTAS